MIVAILSETKKKKGPGAESPTNLGAKVYKRHRVMLKQIAHWQKVSMNEGLRQAIELKHAALKLARSKEILFTEEK